MCWDSHCCVPSPGATTLSPLLSYPAAVSLCIMALPGVPESTRTIPEQGELQEGGSPTLLGRHGWTHEAAAPFPLRHSPEPPLSPAARPPAQSNFSSTEGT